MEEFKMNRLSEDFSDLLFSNFPEFREHLSIKSYNYSNDNLFEFKEALESYLKNDMEKELYEELLLEYPKFKEDLIGNDNYIKGGGYLELEIPHDEEFLSITTIGNEITIGFSWFHIHFNPNKTIEAIDFINGLMNETIIIFAEVHKNENRCCGYIKTEEFNQLKNRLSSNSERIDYIKVKSWNRTYNQTIDE